MLRQMIRKNINLQPSQVKNFVDTASKCNFDVDIYYNRYVVDAKSILGVLGLDFNQKLTVEFSGHNAEFEQYLDTLAVAG
jgi:phosphotransferase system HPr-like phosphotransfer protein